MKKKVFISHPYSDNEAINLEKATLICQKIIESEADILPVSPLHHFSFMDGDEGYREDIMGVCLHNIKYCDELWVFGDSKGCRREAKYAKEIGVPIEYVNNLNTKLFKLE